MRRPARSRKTRSSPPTATRRSSPISDRSAKPSRTPTRAPRRGFRHRPIWPRRQTAYRAKSRNSSATCAPKAKPRREARPSASLRVIREGRSRKHFERVVLSETTNVSEPGIQDPNIAREDKCHRHDKPAGAEQDDLVEKTALDRRQAFGCV